MSIIPEDEQYDINLRNTDGQLFSAVVKLHDRYWIENNLSHVECRIILKWAGVELESVESDYFEAFCRIREELAKRNLLPVCYGASRRIIISGMGRDMGAGLMVYKVLPDNSISIKHLVNIFDTGDDVEPVSVEAQSQFQQAWLEANSKR